MVAAAADLLEDAGVDAVSHRAVARRAGVPLGSTTYYFASLDDLWAAAAGALAQRWVRRAARSAASVPEGSYSEREAAHRLARAVLPAGRPAVLAQYEQLLAAARYPAVAAVLRGMRPAFLEVIDDLLARTGWAGRAGADVVLALVDGAAVSALSEGRGDAREVATDLLAQLLGEQ
ncbi:TetR/AcrR family transcriptional regulator [Actinopolymorpha singaporensis]